MTLREAFETKGYWFAEANPTQRAQVESIWKATYPDDRWFSVKADAPYVCFRPHRFDLLDGYPYDPTDESHLLVPTLARLQQGIAALNDRRIVLPVFGPMSQNHVRTSFYTFNGHVMLGTLGVLTNSDFIDLATFVRTDTDPDV